MTTSIPENLRCLLREFDMYGMPGAYSPHGKLVERCNILVTDVEISKGDDHVMMTATLCTPEGGSSRQFEAGIFSHLGDQILATQRVSISWTHAFMPDSFPRKVILWHVKDAFHDWRADGADYVCDEETLFLPIGVSADSPLHVFEPFAGGYGGWSAAGRILRKHLSEAMQFIGLDHDWSAVTHFAVNHDCCILPGLNPLPVDALTGTDDPIVIHARFEENTWWEAINFWRVDVMTLSAPCPPWSNASSKSGLLSPMGLLLPRGILMLRILRPKVMIVEQVNGFGTHEHKQMVLDCFRHVGYRLRWFRILDASTFGGSSRMRWLGLATRMNDDQAEFVTMQLWPSVQQLTPGNLHAVLPAASNDPQLVISDDVFQLGADFDLLPPFIKPNFRGASPNVIWKSRCTSPAEIAKTFMCKYGQQHELSLQTLKQKGYMGHFLTCPAAEGSEVTRFFHPLEVALIHISHEQVFVAADYRESWSHFGNCICVPQALLLLANAFNCLTRFDDVDVQHLFSQLLEDHLSVNHMTSVTLPIGTVYLDPRLVDMTKQESTLIKLQNMQDLLHKVQLAPFPTHQIWHPTHGMVKVFICEHTKKLWISSNTDVVALMKLYQVAFRILEMPANDEAVSFSLFLDDPTVYYQQHFPTADFLLVVQGGDVTIVSLEQDKPRQDMVTDVLQGLAGAVWHDQFGVLGSASKLANSKLIVDFPIMGGQLPTTPFFLLAASQQSQCSAVWDMKEVKLVFTFYGDMVAVETMMKFWTHVLHPDTLCNLGFKSHAETNSDGHSLHFSLLQDSVMLPMECLCECLQIQGMRTILTSMLAEAGIKVTLKWRGSVVWSGLLPRNFTGQVLLAMLESVFNPFIGDASVRLIHLGRVVYAVGLEELMRLSNSDEVRLHLEFGTAGGTGSKEQLQTHVKNALAATLLDQGFPFQWTSDTMDRLLSAVGAKKLTQLVAMPAGQARLDQLLQLCKNSSIQIPDRVVREASKVAARGVKLTQQRKKQIVQPNPEHYTLQLSYLRNEDGSQPQQLSEVASNVSGLVLMSLSQALPWIREGKVLSKDELTLAIIGHHDLDTSLRTSQCTLPCDHAGDVKGTQSLHAVSVQVHATVKTEKLTDFLAATGFCRLYATPKGIDGRVSASWRVAWVDGDRARLLALATQTVSCAGLVRNKRTWGLRYLCEHFAAAWKIIHESKPLPDDMRVVHLFRVEPLPHGCTSEMLLAWGKQLKWEFRALKALGPRCWMIGSEVLPPSGLHTFNSNPILIKSIPTKRQQVANPILAGPKPSHSKSGPSSASDDLPALQSDPWAPWLRNKASAAPVPQNAPTRTLQGPIEARFIAQEEKISKMEGVLSQLQVAQGQLKADTEQGFAQVAHREKQIEQAITQVRGELEHSFTAALKQQSTDLNSSLSDIKALLMKKQVKRSHEAPADEDMVESDS
eukprot:Skav232687  [mRNA]  locus=scaffold698:582235:586895:- [translate_table: standard]